MFARVEFLEAWTFDESVQPLFPVPSCVLIGRAGAVGALPKQVTSYAGVLPRRDAASVEAARYLTSRPAPWPTGGELTGGSAYREKFRNGATLFPRMLCLVEEAPSVGLLGSAADAPVVQSRRTRQEKEPWKSLPALRQQVEREFLRQVYLGESVAPYRLLKPVPGIIPWDPDSKRLLDAAAAQQVGYPYLAAWLAKAEHLWDTHGGGRMSFGEQLDYFGKLSAQFPMPSVRVVYAKSGTLPAAAIVEDLSAVLDHVLYWAATGKREAQYLTAILNSEAARSRVASMQSRGQWGARHFDKLMFELPIPLFDVNDKLHQELAAAAARAAQVAAKVPLKEGIYFVTARKHIRTALHDDGIAQEIEELVERLLAALAVESASPSFRRKPESRG